MPCQLSGNEGANKNLFFNPGDPNPKQQTLTVTLTVLTHKVIGIVNKIIVEGVGSIHTNTCENINMLCRMMRDKTRVLGAALYCVRTDIAYLMQNQKSMTR